LARGQRVGDLQFGQRVRWKGNNCAQGRPGDGWLAGQFAVERQISGIVQVECPGLVARVIPQRTRDVFLLRAGQQDQNESLVVLVVIEVAIDDSALPEDTAPFVSGRLALHSLPVSFGANHEHKGSLLRTKLLLAPARPAKRRADMISSSASTPCREAHWPTGALVGCAPACRGCS
jgi:hypothetical protein